MPNPIQVQRSFVWIIQKPGDKIAIKPKNMKQFHFLMALIGLIFVNSTYAQPDPQLKKPGMELKPVYIHSHQGGKPLPAELVLELQRTAEKSNAPLWALDHATRYRLNTVASTFEDKTGNRLNIEDYLGPEKTWHAKLNTPDNGFLVSNRNNPGRKIWTYGWLETEFVAPDGTVYPQGWYYFERSLYIVGEKGYIEPEGTIDLDCGKLFPDVPEMQGVFVAWYADGCANPSLPDEIPFKEPIAQTKRQRSQNVVNTFPGSNWVVSVQASNQQFFQPAPQQFAYAGGWGMGIGGPYFLPYTPMFGSCMNCGCYQPVVQQPSSNITNVYEGDTYITNEGDVINEGDMIVINTVYPPVVDNDDEEEPDDDDGGPVLPPNGDDDGGPNLPDDDDGGPVLGENGLTGGGGNLGGSGMALQSGNTTHSQTTKTSSFEDLSVSSSITPSGVAEKQPVASQTSEEVNYWQNNSSELLAMRGNGGTTSKPVANQSPVNQFPMNNSSNGTGVSGKVPTIEQAQANTVRPAGNNGNGNVTAVNQGRVPTIEQVQTDRAPVGNTNLGRPMTVTNQGTTTRVPTIEQAQANPVRPAGNNGNGNVAAVNQGRVPTIEQVQTDRAPVGNTVAPNTNQGGGTMYRPGNSGTTQVSGNSTAGPVSVTRAPMVQGGGGTGRVGGGTMMRRR